MMHRVSKAVYTPSIHRMYPIERYRKMDGRETEGGSERTREREGLTHVGWMEVSLEGGRVVVGWQKERRGKGGEERGRGLERVGSCARIEAPLRTKGQGRIP